MISLAKPKAEDLVAGKHVLRYQKGTIDYELCKKMDEDLNLMAVILIGHLLWKIDVALQGTVLA